MIESLVFSPEKLEEAPENDSTWGGQMSEVKNIMREKAQMSVRILWIKEIGR